MSIIPPRLECDFVSVALSHVERGFPVFPLRSWDKRPLTSSGFYDATSDEAQIRGWGGRWPRANVGIPTGMTSGIVAVDVDPRHGGFESLELLPPLPATLTSLTGGGGRHFLFRAPGKLDIRSSSSKLATGVDIKGSGGYIVAPGSVHESGQPYRWQDPDIPMGELPSEWIVLIESGPKSQIRSTELAVREPIPAGQRNATMFQTAGKLRRLGHGAEAIFALLQIENHGRCVPPLDEAELWSIAKGICRYEPARTYEQTEFGLAERAFDELEGDVLWTKGAGELIYDGSVWNKDDCLDVRLRLQRMIEGVKVDADALPDDAPNKDAAIKFATKIQKASTVRAVHEILRPKIAKSISEFNGAPFLFNVENGTINLMTGVLQPHRKADLLTKISRIRYEPEAQCPKFLQFLGQIMGHDAEMIAYLQRLFGSALCGDPKDIFAVLYGSGGNGKSTFLALMQEIFSAYARATSADVIMERKNDAHLNEIAKLAGARLVVATESKNNHQLNTSQIKSFLGGEPISARFLHQEHFEFIPSFLLVLGTNHKPFFNGDDFGVVRRLRLIPFEVQIDEQHKDRGLKDKLISEKEGILSWLVRGYHDFRAQGFDEPKKVLDQTAQYVREMDTFGLFLEEKVTFEPSGECHARLLFEAYRVWCCAGGFSSMTSAGFGRKMTERTMHQPEVRKSKSNGVYIWRGLRLAQGGF